LTANKNNSTLDKVKVLMSLWDATGHATNDDNDENVGQDELVVLGTS
jgi:hypothetical protein